MHHSLQTILNELRNPDQAKSLEKLYSLADAAAEAVLDEKLLRAGPLEDLAEQLAEVIKLLLEHYPNCPIPDLRYRLAHLYMRSNRWTEAEAQFLELDDYLNTEARIYSVLCQLKLSKEQPELSSIEKQISNISNQLVKPPQKVFWQSRSVQEQHYNLLEMLIYAGNLNHKLLEPYYNKGLTKTDIQVCSNHLRYWLPISRVRLENLVQTQKYLVIFDGKLPQSLEITKTELAPPIRKIAQLLVDAYPGFVTREQLKIELRDYWNGSRRATLTEWKNKLEEVLSNRDAVKVIDGHFNNDLDATKYELQHPFLKLRRRKSEGR